VVLVVNALLILLDPVTESSGGLNGNTLLTLKIHGIHLGTDAVTPADLVDSLDTTGVEKDSLGTGGLAAVDMGLRKYISLDTILERVGSNWGMIYRNTDVTALVKTSGLDRIKVVNNGGLGQAIWVGLSSLETATKTLEVALGC
jgi:hypothetical protein